ncbi:hypothetical protein [Gordonia sp. N1V]|uniref:hypothetical protein n=1 Tax=Gordonia sp. N1V TaxID=3034163 RepID=UPI0023E31D30|nr:hypothetical protein [Gordonia sp. N1V]MDF3281681.1 hypothetical protein [Gordonia sp. N1V]
MGKLRLRDITPEEKQRFAICAHEAGHAITATVLGDTVGTVALTPDHPRNLGQCTLAAEQFPGVNAARIAFTGPYAEAYWRHGGPPTSGTLRRVLTASGREDERVVRASGDPRPEDVPRLIANCWGSISGLARHLFINGTATQADVDRALWLQEDEPEARAFALASIRSGRTPGSFKVIPALL